MRRIAVVTVEPTLADSARNDSCACECTVRLHALEATTARPMPPMSRSQANAFHKWMRPKPPRALC